MDAVDSMITQRLRKDLQRELEKLSDADVETELRDAKKSLFKSVNRSEVRAVMILVDECEKELQRRREKNGGNRSQNKPKHN